MPALALASLGTKLAKNRTGLLVLASLGSLSFIYSMLDHRRESAATLGGLSEVPPERQQAPELSVV